MGSSESKPIVVNPSLTDRLSHNFQLWCLLNKEKMWFFHRFFFNVISFYELALYGADGGEQWRKRLAFKGDFVFGGCVYTTDYDTIEKALLEPQARGLNLAGVPLNPQRVPTRNMDKNRFTTLVVLSQAGAGGNGDWEAFRAAMEDFFTHSEGSMARRSDDVAKKLYAKVTEDYKTLGHTKKFFENDTAGLQDFLLRYLHYVILGLDPYDEDSMKLFRKFNYEYLGPAYFINSGWIDDCLGCVCFRDWDGLFRNIADIYMDSPSLENFPEGSEKYGYATKDEVARFIVSLMTIAALVGPLEYARMSMGAEGFELHKHVGHDTHKIDVKEIWDKIDLDDKGEVMRYLMECGRLRQPVRKTPRLVTPDETFTVDIEGKQTTFPTGTVVLTPMQFAMVDEKVWGPTAFEFNHDRPELAERFMTFHAVGERTNGRICPGKDIALGMISELIVRLGKVRRAPGFNPKGIK